MLAIAANPHRIKAAHRRRRRGASRVRFPGQYFDKETGLNYNYFRDYEPGTGRYVESDPLGLYGGVNTYAYVRSNPLKLADLIGLCPCPGGYWTEDKFDFSLGIGFGAYIQFNKANVRCVADPNVTAYVRQTTIAGGPIATVGAGWSFSGAVYGVYDSTQLEGWSTNQCFGSFGPLGLSAPCGSPGGGSASLGPSFGGGMAWGSTYTHILHDTCPHCKDSQ